MMLKTIKLYFTNRPSYEQQKRYTKLQKKYRKNLKKQAKAFCPWSGYYMHEMIVTMLRFYMETFKAGDCCWRETESRLELTKSMKQALDYATKLELIDTMDETELITLAKKDKIAFDKYVRAWETNSELCIAESAHSEHLLAGLAEDYLTKKYTKAMYKIIGEYIWEWYD